MKKYLKQEEKGLLEVKEIIKQKPYIVWYCQNVEGLSEEAVIENILNWGDFEDVQKMIELLGVQKIADIFYKQISGKRDNYKPEIKNYFKLYFNKYASRSFK